MRCFKLAIGVLACLLGGVPSGAAAPEVPQAGPGHPQPAAASQYRAFADVSRLPSAESTYTRYIAFWGSDGDDKYLWWAAVAGQLNALSLGPRIVSPPLVLDDGRVKVFAEMQDADWARLAAVRVDLRCYRQLPRQWDKLGDPSLEPLYHVWVKDAAGEWRVGFAPWLVEPLGVDPGDWPVYRAALVGLWQQTGKALVPIIEARNFIWQVAIDFDRPAGYYSWLGVKDRATWEKLVRLQQDTPVLRDAVSKSGVAKQPRVVERYGRGDAVWYTKDQVERRGQANRNPLLQLDPHKFRADAVEGFGRLDNDWWALVAFNLKDGTLQQSAPDGIGYHKWTKSNDGKIHVGYVCFDCHDRDPGNGGLQPFTPYFRTLFSRPGAVGLPLQLKQSQQLADEYLDDLNDRMEADRQAYAAAVRRACGRTPQQWARAVTETFHAWDEEVTPTLAAWEHGVAEADMVKLLHAAGARYGQLDNQTSTWLKPAAQIQPIGRDQATETYNLVELALRGLPVWSPATKAKLRPWVGTN